MLADTLDDRGHSVAVIDQDARAFRRLSSRFGGRTITGIGFDRETLESAGIEEAHAFAAVSSGDNTNIIAARTARETYGVENVVARIYDPRRAEVYQRLGIPTVATVSWTSHQIIRRLLPAGSQVEFQDSSGFVTIAEVGFHESWIGTPLEALEAALGVRVAFLTRHGRGFNEIADLVLQDSDLLHLVMATQDSPRIEAQLAAPRTTVGRST